MTAATFISRYFLSGDDARCQQAADDEVLAELVLELEQVLAELEGLKQVGGRGCWGGAVLGRLVWAAAGWCGRAS